MFLSLLSIIVLTFTIILYIRSNPLSIGVIVLLLALRSTFIVSLIISSWLCFLIFLIYIGGILVLFSYFVAITPNIPIPSLILNITILFISPIIILILIFYPSTAPISSQQELYISFLYSENNYQTLIILATVLLLTIIIVVKLISIKTGPLRPFNAKYV